MDPELLKKERERVELEERATLRLHRREFIDDLKIALAAIEMSDKAGCSDDAFAQFVHYTARNFANLAELMEKGVETLSLLDASK